MKEESIRFAKQNPIQTCKALPANNYPGAPWPSIQLSGATCSSESCCYKNTGSNNFFRLQLDGATDSVSQNVVVAWCCLSIWPSLNNRPWSVCLHAHCWWLSRALGLRLAHEHCTRSRSGPTCRGTKGQRSTFLAETQEERVCLPELCTAAVCKILDIHCTPTWNNVHGCLNRKGTAVAGWFLG